MHAAKKTPFLGVAVALLMAATSSISPAADMSAPISIGLDADMSSGAAQSGEAIRRGAMVAIEEISVAGVEEKAQVDFLRKEGCNQVQGYYFARPLPAADFLKWYRQNLATRAVANW